MKLTLENTKGKKVKVYDVHDHEIMGVYFFDTETEEIGFYPSFVNEKGKRRFYIEGPSKNSESNRVKKINTIMQGAYAIVDGERVK